MKELFPDRLFRTLMRWKTRARLSVCVSFAVLTLLSGCGQPLDSFNPVTPQGVLTTNLFNIALVISLFVALLVGGVLLYSIARFRARPGDPDPEPPPTHRNLEIAWTATPALVLAALFVGVVFTMRGVEAKTPDAPRIAVIGHQWWWEYRYPDSQVVTANELHLPVGQLVVLQLQSDDVLHSYWIPRFGWKKDAVPGKINDLPVRVDEAGTYDGACAQYCGNQHAWMRIRVVAQSPGDFQSWVQGQQQPGAAPADAVTQRGQQVFLSNTCVSCHAVAGTAAQGQVGPNLTHLGSRSTLGAGVIDNSQDNLKRWIRNAQDIKPGILMPAYNQLSLSDDDLEALSNYLEALK